MSAVNVNNLFPSPMASTNDQALTVDSTAGGVQLTVPAGCQYVMWQVQTAPIRCTIDGSAPTTTNGYQLAVGKDDVWSAAMAKAAKFIRETGTSGILFASYLTD